MQASKGKACLAVWPLPNQRQNQGRSSASKRATLNVVSLLRQGRNNLSTLVGSLEPPFIPWKGSSARVSRSVLVLAATARLAVNGPDQGTPALSSSRMAIPMEPALLLRSPRSPRCVGPGMMSNDNPKGGKKKTVEREFIATSPPIRSALICRQMLSSCSLESPATG